MVIDLIDLVTNKKSNIGIDSDVVIPNDLLNNSNIKRLESIHVRGNIKKILDEYNFVGNITGNMILPDDLTLEDVLLPININFDENFTENMEDSENNLIIIQNKLDIIPFLWQNIVLEVPSKIRGNNDNNINLAGDGWRFITEEELNISNNSPFSNLEELINSRKE